MSDLVAIFDGKLRQILKTSQPTHVSVKESARIPEHPLENGSVINDHKIIDPVEVEIQLFLNPAEYKNVYSTIKQLFLSSELITVQTRTASYTQMTISELPHEETVEVYDSIMIPVRFKEIRFAPSQYGVLPASSVQQPSDSSTQDRGEQQPEAQSFLHGLFN